jgi:hypothetical protein
MATVDFVLERLGELRAEIERLSAARRRSGRLNYYAAYTLLVLTILSSAAAGIASFLNQPAEFVGVLAFIPGVLTLALSQLKLQARSSWHHQKNHLLQGLLNKIKYQTPPNPSADQLAALASEFSGINRTMAAQWTATLGLDAADAGRQPA